MSHWVQENLMWSNCLSGRTWLKSAFCKLIGSCSYDNVAWRKWPRWLSPKTSKTAFLQGPPDFWDTTLLSLLTCREQEVDSSENRLQVVSKASMQAWISRVLFTVNSGIIFYFYFLRKLFLLSSFLSLSSFSFLSFLWVEAATLPCVEHVSVVKQPAESLPQCFGPGKASAGIPRSQRSTQVWVCCLWGLPSNLAVPWHPWKW